MAFDGTHEELSDIIFVHFYLETDFVGPMLEQKNFIDIVKIINQNLILLLKSRFECP